MPSFDSMSVGRLLAMPPGRRKRAIASMSPEMRLALSHLATYGLRRAIEKVQKYTNEARGYQDLLLELTEEEQS